MMLYEYTLDIKQVETKLSQRVKSFPVLDATVFTIIIIISFIFTYIICRKNVLCSSLSFNSKLQWSWRYESFPFHSSVWLETRKSENKTDKQQRNINQGVKTERGPWDKRQELERKREIAGGRCVLRRESMNGLGSLLQSWKCSELGLVSSRLVAGRGSGYIWLWYPLLISPFLPSLPPNPHFSLSQSFFFSLSLFIFLLVSSELFYSILISPALIFLSFSPFTSHLP